MIDTHENTGEFPSEIDDSRRREIAEFFARCAEDLFAHTDPEGTDRHLQLVQLFESHSLAERNATDLRTRVLMSGVQVRRVPDNQLLSIPERDVWVVPTFQLETRATEEAAALINAELGAQNDPWAAADWWYRLESGELRRIEALRQGLGDELLDSIRIPFFGS